MSKQIIINYITVFEEDDVEYIGFAENPSGEGDYLMLQNSKKYNSQDIKLGMDSYYIECSLQHCCQYGGIEYVTLNSGALYFNFDKNSKIGKKYSLVKLKILDDNADLVHVMKRISSFGIFTKL